MENKEYFMAETAVSNAGEVVASIDASESQDSQKPSLTEGEISQEELDAADEAEENQEPSAEAKSKDDKAKTKEEKQIQNLKKKLKLKVDGEDIEEEIDLNNEEELKKHLQLSKAAQKRMQETATLKKQLAEFVETMKKDPGTVLAQLGISVDEFAEKHIEKMIESAKKSPEQLEKEKMEQELKALKEQVEKEKRDKENAELERLRDQEAANIEKDINDYLTSAKSVLPKSNPWVLRTTAQYMLLAMKNGYNNVTVKDVIPVVERQFQSDLQELFGVMPEDTMEMVIGKNNLERLRKMRLKQRKVQTTTTNQIAKSTGNERPRDEKPQGKQKTYKSLFGIGDD